MFQIYSEMIKRSNNVTYEDIFHFREENICDTNKAIFELSSPHQRPLSMYSTMGHPYGSCSKSVSHRTGYMKDLNPPHYQWHEGHYLPSEGHQYGTMIPPNQHLPPHYFYPTNGCSYPPPRAYYSGPSLHHAVPTGQLIELESSHSKNHVNEKAHRRNGSEPLKHDYGHIEDEPDYRHSKELVQNWLYYDELVNEREELARKVCEEMLKVNLSDPPDRSAKKKEKKLPKESIRPVSLRPTSTYEQVEPPLSQKIKSKTYSTPNLDMWECLSCTYHNKGNVDVCEMCDKSRIQGNEVLPLISGGRECHKCTLVNERGEQKCSACGECLKDSPTYI